MSMLSQQAIIDYQRIYKQKYGEDIQFDEAKKQGEGLLRFVQIMIYRQPKPPINTNEYEK